jgi:hypothetical protein
LDACAICKSGQLVTATRSDVLDCRINGSGPFWEICTQAQRFSTTAIMHALLALLSASGALAAPALKSRADIKCPIVFDGRVPTAWAADPTQFDTYATNTIFNPDYVKGNDIKWSQILKFPNVTKSRFDTTEHTPLEVTLSDQSIFQQQKGFRRAGLQFLKDAADGPGQTGVKTLHFSVKQDPARPLNLTHEYLVSTLQSRSMLCRRKQNDANHDIERLARESRLLSRPNPVPNRHPYR